MDSAGIMTTVSPGLGPVDQFRGLVLRFRKEEVTPPAGPAHQSAEGEALELSDHSHVVEVHVAELCLDKWDNARYRALERRVRVNWELFNEFFAQDVADHCQLYEISRT